MPWYLHFRCRARYEPYTGSAPPRPPPAQLDARPRPDTVDEDAPATGDDDMPDKNAKDASWAQPTEDAEEDDPYLDFDSACNLFEAAAADSAGSSASYTQRG